MMSWHVSKTRGFSQLEVIIVTAIASLWLSLFTVGVLLTRERSRNVTCQDRLGDLGRAWTAFEGAHRVFPYTKPSDFNRGDGHGWLPLLLPYVGDTRLADEFHYELNWSAAENAGVIGQVVDAFICPAAPNDMRIISEKNYSHELWSYPDAATTDYIGVQGILMTMKGTDWIVPGLEPRGCGAIGDGRGWRIDDFPDGTSCTIAISEDAGRPYIWRMGKMSPTDHTPTILPERPNLSGAWAAQNTTGYRSFTSDGLRQPGTCPLNCSNWIGGIYSFHEGGANSVFVDGSVKFLSQDMDVYLMYCLVTRAGGEVINTNDF